MNYKKFYEERVGEKIDGRKYHIHHIDGNRENNDFYNLLMLPKELHKKYHALKDELPLDEKLGDFIITEINTVVGMSVGTNFLCIKLLKDFTKVRSECQKWVDYKAYKMGLMPNIHNIELENEA